MNQSELIYPPSHLRLKALLFYLSMNSSVDKTTFVYSSAKLLISFLIALFHFLLIIMPATADDYISPDLVKVTTPRYSNSDNFFVPTLGTYSYTVSWQGIPAASASATVRREKGALIVDATARTYSGVDLLYKLRYSLTSIMNGKSLYPSSLVIDHRENSRIKLIDAKFNLEEGEISANRSRPDTGEIKQVSFSPKNLTLDPVSAGFLARSLDWKVGDTHTFDVFNGKSRYLIALSATARKSIEHLGQVKDCFVISPRVRNLTTTKAVEKLREASIFVTADEKRDIIKIVSSVFIGAVTTELVSFTPPVANDSSNVLLAGIAGAENDDTLLNQTVHEQKAQLKRN